MNNKPLFSVVTICYNAENCIKKTIESVLAQAGDISAGDNTPFLDFEYIIQDGASSDSTLDIVASYKEAFERAGVSFIINSGKDAGIYDAMNRAVEASSGEYVIFMNSDDCFYSESVLSSVAGKLKDYSYDNNTLPDIVYGDCIVKELGMYFLYRKTFDQIKERMPFSHQACFAKRELLVENPLNTSYRITADYGFILSSYLKNKSFFDSDIRIALVTGDGLSTVNMLDTFVEVNSLCNDLNMPRYTESEYAKKLKEIKLKQFVITYFPNFIKRIIRKNQIKKRGQITDVTIPSWCK